MKNQHWSGKHVTVVEGDRYWVRADYLDKLRRALVASGRVETGNSLVTGGKQYFEFLRPQAA